MVNLKITLRKLWQDRFYSFINVLGLTIGLLTAMLLLTWVWGEFRVNRFHENGDRVYRLNVNLMFGESLSTWTSFPHKGRNKIAEDFPEVENIASVLDWDHTFQTSTDQYKTNGIITDADFLKMFNFSVLAGSASAVFDQPKQIALSSDFGKKLFKHADYQAMIGQTVTVWKNKKFTVRAIIETPSKNSTIRFSFIQSATDYFNENPKYETWHNFNSPVYCQLRTGTNPTAFETKIKSIIPRDEDDTDEEGIITWLQPFEDIHLYGRFENGMVIGGRIDYIKIILIAAFLLLFVACINFINLSTARATKQSKSIGIRKIIGANRSSLISQYLLEALALVVLAFMLALMLTEFSAPFLDKFSTAPLSIDYFHPYFWVGAAGLILLTAGLAGAYPAFFLSGIDIQQILKKEIHLKGGLLRKILVVTQFSLSVILILGTLLIHEQINFIQQKNIGIKKDHVLSFWMEQEMKDNSAAFLNEISQIPGVKNYSRAGQNPIHVQAQGSGIKIDHANDYDESVLFNIITTDHHFTSVFHPTIIKGEDFVDMTARDTANFLVNETMVKKYGWENPIGKHLQVWGSSGTIVGVLKDFNFKSIHSKIEPLIVVNNPKNANKLYVAIEPGKTAEVISSIESIHKKFAPAFPFEYQFMDEQYQKLYEKETQTSTIMSWFAMAAILLSCLGLFGLTAFLTEQKHKEIGIRKVLGASITDILQLLSKDFIRLVLLAMLIGIPIAWWLMNQWLEEFAYATSINWQVILLSCLILMGMTILTVAFQSIKAAVANPVASLRDE